MFNIIQSEISRLGYSHLLGAPMIQTMAEIAHTMAAAVRMQRKILVAGTGHAAHCAHLLAAPLVQPATARPQALPFIVLAPDIVWLNGVDRQAPGVFAGSLAAYACAGDLLVLFAYARHIGALIDDIRQAQALGLRVILFMDEASDLLRATLGRYDLFLQSPGHEMPSSHFHVFMAEVMASTINTYLLRIGHQRPEKIQNDWSTLQQLTQGLRPLVFTNGVFDILHRGHVHSLEEARRQGAYLVVGVNSDDSVRRLGKGPDRPIQSQEDRSAVLAGLSSVDFVSVFDADTPYQLIAALQPDVLVKGGDYRPEQIAGADIVTQRGGKVVIVPFQHQRSTTTIIRKIRDSDDTQG